GYLIATPGELVFVTRRLFVARVHRVSFVEIATAEWKRGMLTNRLILGTSTSERTFYLFKDIDLRTATTPQPVVDARWAKPVPAQTPVSVVIYCRVGPMQGHQIEVPAVGMCIGREARSAQLVIDSPEVSSRHAR